MKLDYLEKGITFLKALNGSDKVLLYFDADGDGLCSGALISEWLDENNVPHHDHVKGHNDRGELAEVFKRLLKKHKATHFITCDMSLEASAAKFLGENKTPTLVIDHHDHVKEVPSNIAYVNPRMHAPPGQEVPATSALAYYLYSHSGGKKNLKWVGYAGSYSDLVLVPSLPLLELEPLEMENMMPNGQIVPPFGILEATSVPYLDESKGGMVFELVKEAIKANDKMFFWREKKGKARKVFSIYEKGEKEARYWYNKFLNGEGVIDHENKLVVFKMKPKLQIKRIISTVLKISFTGYTIMAGIEENGNVNFSNRSYSVDLSRAIPEAVQGIPGASGGGHPKAAGARLPLTHEKEFLEKFKAAMKKYPLN